MRTGSRLFARGSWPETARVADLLRTETIGGFLLLAGAVVALAWANSPWRAEYTRISETRVGSSFWGLHLDLTLHDWAADGLLAIFFFVVGLELKREFVAGDLRDPARAALPIAAAVGGMIAPAALFVAITVTGGGDAAGWAVPTATDIAFAVAVLAVVSTHLPSALRTFLLTLAVVDDLLAITVIAVFYSASPNMAFLALTVVPLALFAVCVQCRVRSWWVLVPLAALTWVCMHESGIHATVAGVALGFTVPVLRSDRAGGPHAGPGLAEHLEHRIRPLSTGVAVPAFAFFAAGVTIGGFHGLAEAFADPVAIAVVVGLVVGKPVGIFGTTRVLAAVTRASLDASVAWIDVLGVAVLAGIGFTVSLLIGELAYGSERGGHVTVAVLIGSSVAAVLAAVLLRVRNGHYRRIARDGERTGAQPEEPRHNP